MSKKSRKDLTFDEIAEALANCDGTSVRQSELLAELTRRATIAQIDAAKSQRGSAIWVAIAGIAAAVSAIASLIVAFHRP